MPPQGHPCRRDRLLHSSTVWHPGNQVSVTSPPNRLAYLDWLRGAAVLIMIQTHVFNSMTRTDLHGSAGYMLSQFIGGMAAPLFLFMAGVTLAFRIDSRERRGYTPVRLFRDSLSRAGYIFVVAILFRLQLWVFQFQLSDWRNVLRVDILNCMALALAIGSTVALLPRARWFSASVILGSLIAGVAPLVASLDWSGLPWPVRNYLVPAPNCFSLFPNGAYVPLGLAAGFVLRNVAAEALGMVLRWVAIIGFGLVSAGHYFSNLPFSIYPQSDFWRTSPGLIVIRTGIMLLGLALAYLCTRVHIIGSAQIQQLGITSLLVYWVHVELVYGYALGLWKKQLVPLQSALLAAAVMILMYWLSVAKTRWLSSFNWRDAFSPRIPVPRV